MVFKLTQEDGGILRVLLPKPGERRKKVKVMVGEWDKTKDLANKSDLLVLTKPHDMKSSQRKGAFLVKGPGEYEVQGVFVKGIKDSVYMIWGEDQRMAYIPCSADMEKEFEVKVLDQMGEVDLLVLGLDWDDLPKSKNLRSVISQIEPSIIVFVDGDKKKTDIFLKEMDIKKFEREDEISLNLSDFKEDKETYYVLER